MVPMNARLVVVWMFSLLIGSTLEGAPFLEGRVVDEEGRPIAGASVRIADCLGTCVGGKTVLTDKDGRYVFKEKTFRNFPALSVSLPGRYEVSREVTGPKLHDPDTEVARKTDFVLGTPAEALVCVKGNVPEGWTQEVVLRSGKDAKMHRYDEVGRRVSGGDSWNFETLPRGESLHLVVIREPIVEKSDDPKVMQERALENTRKRIEIISAGIRLIDPHRHIVEARVEEDAASGTFFIVIESISDAIGSERSQELVVADPAYGPPVDAATRERAVALLKRVESAAEPWNARPTAQVASYEYDAINVKGEKRHVKIDKNSSTGPAWSDIARQRGSAYMPPLRWLFKEPENVEFHGVEISEERAVLYYRLKSQRGFGVGVGIGPSWNGFLTASFNQGVIVLDPKQATVLEHRMSSAGKWEESIETFDDYVAVGNGFAPQTLRLQSGGMDLFMKFHVHQERLWLLREAKHNDQEKPALTVENVVVSLGD